MKKMWIVIGMLLCLPNNALAVREGVIEEAPIVDMETVSYLPSVRKKTEETGWMLEEEYTAIDTCQLSPDEWRNCMTSNSGLTTGERKRMEKLMAAYAAGERTGDGASVLEAKKRVRVGVYALEPEEFDGETTLLLLTGLCLTDEEMLAILDAYHQLGETFDPDALNERNCVRGQTFGRMLSYEENERNERLIAQIERGILKREDVPETLRAVELDESAFLGSYDGKFILEPYRRMTDEELADSLFLKGFKNECEGIDADRLERNARLALYEKGCPLSMELFRIRKYAGDKRTVGLTFSYADENGNAQTVYAEMNAVTGEVRKIEF